jgi:hypothetical protein
MEIPKPAFIGNKHHKSLIDSVELALCFERGRKVYNVRVLRICVFLFLKARSSDPRFMHCRLSDSKPCRRSEAPEPRVQAGCRQRRCWSSCTLSSPRVNESPFTFTFVAEIFPASFESSFDPVMQCSAFKSTVYRRTWVLIWTSFFLSVLARQRAPACKRMMELVNNSALDMSCCPQVGRAGFPLRYVPRYASPKEVDAGCAHGFPYL